jgi:glycosyltransferase involved in cell wall biosynthesis
VSRVSVIVPVRDGERYLAEALDSILAQSHPAVEVIVVDDGSTDGTAGVVEGFGAPVRRVAQAPAGVGAAMNHGLREAGGELIASLDADDLWTPDKLARQVAALETDPSLDIVFGHAVNFASPDLDSAERARLAVPAGALPGYSKGAMLARRAAVDRVGPFDESLRVGDFVDWHARAVDAELRMEMLPEVVLRRRLHAANSGRGAGEARVDFVRVARAALHRRRARAT